MAKVASSPYPLVLVEWIDSVAGTTGWARLADAVVSPTMCRSVGWLVQDDAQVKLLVPHLSEANKSAEAQGCGDMTIPSAAVVRIIALTPRRATYRVRPNTSLSKRSR